MPLFKRIRELRRFRNEVLHGNFSYDDHVIRTFFEDGHVFFWWPAVDEYQQTREDNSTLNLPLARLLFTKKHAEAVRRDVEAAIDAVIDAMQPEYRAWAAAWRHNRSVPAILNGTRWSPRK